MSLTIHVLFFGSLYFIPSFPFFDSKIYVLISLFNCFISCGLSKIGDFHLSSSSVFEGYNDSYTPLLTQPLTTWIFLLFRKETLIIIFLDIGFVCFSFYQNCNNLRPNTLETL